MDQIETEIVSMDLIGNSPGLGDTEVMLSLVAPSAGETEETANNNAGYLDLPPFYPGTAESFFDVFVKVILYDQGEIVLHNVDPVRIVATVSEKPVAADETYASTGSPVMLYDDDSKPTPMSISSMSYTPDKSLFCYGIPHDDPSVCSGNGMCIDTDTCICEAGWTGDECSTLI